MANPSRRAVLGAGVFVTAAGVGVALGFDRTVHHKVAVAPPPPPATLTAALSAHRQLVAMCEDAVGSDAATEPKLTPLRNDLAEHVDALEAVLETYPGWRYARSAATASQTPSTAHQSPSPTSPPASVASVGAAARRQADQLGATCLAWPPSYAAAGAQSTVVPLLGSIAACLVVHTGLLA